jgi:filamentous hemagglutinin
LAVFDVKRGTNGFDLAYVVRDGGSYKLVIVEAKSGSVGKLTAFGEGMRGEAQLQTNLQTVRKAVDSSNLPAAVKDAAREQLNARTFQTELFMGETSNLNFSKLDFLSSVTGKPVQKIIVLPMMK